MLIFDKLCCTFFLIFLVVFQVDAGAINKTLIWKERPRMDRVSVIPYTVRNIGSTIGELSPEILIQWVLIYLSRAAGLYFEKDNFTEGRKIVYYLVSNRAPRSTPQTSLTGENIIELSGREPKLRNILRQTLYVLGMIYEHEREDRHQFIHIPHDFTQDYPIKKDGIQLATPYDIASIMHLPLKEFNSSTQAKVKTLNQKYDKVVNGTRSFLSSCDWATLQAMYPDLKIRQTCSPGTVLSYLEPSSTLLRYFNFDAYTANDTCLYDDSGWTEVGACRLYDGQVFPAIPNKYEAFFVPSAYVKRRIIANFCLEYKSTLPNVMKTEECTSHCIKSCTKNYGTVPVTRCMKHKYPVCRLNKSRKLKLNNLDI